MAGTDTSSAPSHPLIESDHIEGTAVFDANRKRIGTIKRLVIEKISGQVVYAVTSFGGFLGAGSETHTIPLGTAALRHDAARLPHDHHGGASAPST